MKISTIGVWSFAALMVAGCEQQPRQFSRNNLNEIEKAKVATTTELSNPQSLMTQIALSNLKQIELCAYMIKLTENIDVQDLSTMLLLERMGIDRDLRTIAKRYKIIIPQKLEPQTARILAEMQPLKEEYRNLFYANLMEKENAKFLHNFRQIAIQETNPAIKAFATSQIERLEQQFEMTKHVAEIMRSIQDDKGQKPLEISQDESVV